MYSQQDLAAAAAAAEAATSVGEVVEVVGNHAWMW
jgi:hypothetical protein